MAHKKGLGSSKNGRDASIASDEHARMLAALAAGYVSASI